MLGIKGISSQVSTQETQQIIYQGQFFSFPSTDIKQGADLSKVKLTSSISMHKCIGILQRFSFDPTAQFNKILREYREADKAIIQDLFTIGEQLFKPTVFGRLKSSVPRISLNTNDKLGPHFPTSPIAPPCQILITPTTLYNDDSSDEDDENKKIETEKLKQEKAKKPINPFQKKASQSEHLQRKAMKDVQRKITQTQFTRRIIKIANSTFQAVKESIKLAMQQ